MKDETHLARPFIFYVATLLFFGVGGITSIGLNWYAGLTVPSWTPPDLLVAIIWGILFLCSAFSVSMFWEKSVRNDASFTSVISLYMANAMLILLWNYLFFGIHNLVAAFWVAIFVGASVLVLILRIWKEARTSALLLIPYFAWMVFAIFLTYMVMLLNP